MNKKKKKKLWIPAVALLLVAEIAAGVILVPKLMPQEEVLVYSFDMLGYRNYGYSGTESYGLVGTDRVQSAYVSETQKVTEIMVYQGQTVAKGDVLFTYDTTLSDLELERKELEIQQMEMNLKTARSDLKTIKAMKPMVIPNEPTTSKDEDDDDDTKIPAGAEVGKIYNADSAKGTQLKPYYVWLKSDSSVTEEMIYEYLQTRNSTLKDGSYVYVVFRYSSGNKTNAKVTKEYGMRYWLEKGESTTIAAAFEVEENLTSQLTDPGQSAQETAPTDETSATDETTATEAPGPGKPALSADGAVVKADAVTLVRPSVPAGYSLVYRMGTGGNQWGQWQSYETFDGLTPQTKYYFQAGFVDQATGGEPVEVSDAVEITTAAAAAEPEPEPEKISAPILTCSEENIGEHYIKLNVPAKPAGHENLSVEYQITEDGVNWVTNTNNTKQYFDELKADTTYYFRARFLTAEGEIASEFCEPLKVTTRAEEELVVHMRFYDPSSRSQVDDDNDSIVWNSGYTASEIATMKAEKTAEIEELQFQIKIGKAELKIMEKEADSGEVVAEFDGVVMSVLEPDNALSLNAPLVKVAGGGGFYVEGSVSELDLSSIQVGQTVTVTSWENYMTYEGVIVEVGEYPTESENYFYSGSSVNMSYYPYKVFIDESADLQEGSYVSMTYAEQTGETGALYLENAFLRNENGEYYVYVRNAEGLLEKRTVQVGDTSDSYMTEILSGISETDYIAFPYGKTVKEGAPTAEGTWEDLYGY